MALIPSHSELLTASYFGRSEVNPRWYSWFSELAPASAFMRTLLDDLTATDALATLGITAGTWTPTYSDSGGPAVAATTHQAKYTRIGTLVVYELEFTITNTGGGTGFIIHSFPVTLIAASIGVGREFNVTGRTTADYSGSIYFYDNAVTNIVGYRYIASGIYHV